MEKSRKLGIDYGMRSTLDGLDPKEVTSFRGAEQGDTDRDRMTAQSLPASLTPAQP